MTEEVLHRQVCDYLRLQYPNVLFRSDLGGVRLTPGLRARSARLQAGRAWPDLFVAEPRGGWKGLFIELKKDGARIYLRSGKLSADPHIQEQAALIYQLQLRGYRADFAVGFDAARLILDQYLADELNEEGSNGN